MARILLLTLVFRPDNVSTAQIMGDLALDLKARGHTLQVFTNTPCYNRDAEADARFLHLNPQPLLDITIPSTTQTHLAMGKPMLAAVGRAVTKLVEDGGAGLAGQPGHPSANAEAELHLVNHGREKLETMGADGRPL